MGIFKDGYKTTEFWLTLAVSLWGMFSGQVEAPYNAIIPLVASSVYAVARGLAKGGLLKGTVGAELAAIPDKEVVK